MFKGRHFDRSVILLCVRWYPAYGLSLRDLKEMMAERGVSIDHSTIRRWAVHLSPLLGACPACLSNQSGSPITMMNQES